MTYAAAYPDAIADLAARERILHAAELQRLYAARRAAWAVEINMPVVRVRGGEE